MPNPPLNHDQLQLLLDKEACLDVLARYCYALDWIDEALLRTVFHPDADIDYGFFKGKGKDFIPAVMAVERAAYRRWHHSANTLLRIAGDVAEAESYAFTNMMNKGPDGTILRSIFFGRYHDRLERRDGRWWILRRTYMMHGGETAPYKDPEGNTLPMADALSPDHPMFRRWESR